MPQPIDHVDIIIATAIPNIQVELEATDELLPNSTTEVRELWMSQVGSTVETFRQVVSQTARGQLDMRIRVKAVLVPGGIGVSASTPAAVTSPFPADPRTTSVVFWTANLRQRIELVAEATLGTESYALSVVPRVGEAGAWDLKLAGAGAPAATGWIKIPLAGTSGPYTGRMLRRTPPLVEVV